MWKKFLSPSYFNHRLLKQLWMYPLPLRAFSPKLLRSRKLKSLLIYSVTGVRDHFWLLPQTASNMPGPGLIRRLHRQTVTQFNTQKTDLQQDDQETQKTI